MTGFDGGGHDAIRQHWRGEIKFGIDSGAAAIDLNNVQTVRVSDLISQDPPQGQDEGNPLPDRQSPVETTVFRVTVNLDGHKQEQDSDYHLAISDPDDPSAQMVAEIPDPSFLEDGDPFFQQISAARAAAQAKLHFRSPVHFAMAPAAGNTALALIPDRGVQVTITGIGFFDFTHGAKGAAPNGIELHPVLDIEFL